MVNYCIILHLAFFFQGQSITFPIPEILAPSLLRGGIYEQEKSWDSRPWLSPIPPSFLTCANVVGQLEGQGPLGKTFDLIDSDDTFGESTWEKSESAMQKKALTLALDKLGQGASTLDWLFAGDLLNQCIGSSFAAREQHLPFFGLYGACSTMGEGLILASMALDGDFGRRAGVMASSHFCTAERQYRTPLEYGSQRTPNGPVDRDRGGRGDFGPGGAWAIYYPCDARSDCGQRGVTDTNNMGAAMTPAAYSTISAHLRDTGRSP